MKTPKGTRDIAPPASYAIKKIIEKTENTFLAYGFRPLYTPAFEHKETLFNKAGAEIEKQIFNVEEEYALRFDLTVPLARYFSHCPDPLPFKRYAIERVWRKEEPQKGRYREFFQADADIIGSKSMRCEVELLTMAHMLLSSLGFKEKILLNNRKIMEAAAQKYNIDKKQEFFRIMDKIDKIGLEKVKEEVSRWKRGEELIEDLTASNNDEALEIAASLDKEGAEELRFIIENCGFDINVELHLVRGLSYYTGPIFEIKAGEGVGSVMAGGRYDKLMALYGRDAPAVGISLGVDRLAVLVEENKKTHVNLFIATITNNFKKITEIAEKLRSNNIATDVELHERNLKKQLSYANAMNIRYVLIIGEKEVREGKYILKDMKNGEEKTMNLEQVIEYVRGTDHSNER